MRGTRRHVGGRPLARGRAAGAAARGDRRARPASTSVRAFPISPRSHRAAWLSALRQGLRGLPASSLGYGDPRGRRDLARAARLVPRARSRRARRSRARGRVRGIPARPLTRGTRPAARGAPSKESPVRNPCGGRQNTWRISTEARGPVAPSAAGRCPGGAHGSARRERAGRGDLSGAPVPARRRAASRPASRRDHVGDGQPAA